MSFSEEQVLDLIMKARIEGHKEGLKQLVKLQNQGDKWVVNDGFTGKEVGRMLDLCGGAWLVIDAKQPFYRVASKIEKKYGAQKYRFMCGRHYGGGGSLSIFDMSNRQEASVNEACCKGARDFLEKYGVKVQYIHTYID